MYIIWISTLTYKHKPIYGKCTAKQQKVKSKLASMCGLVQSKPQRTPTSTHLLSMTQCRQLHVLQQVQMQRLVPGNMLTLTHTTPPQDDMTGTQYKTSTQIIHLRIHRRTADSQKNHPAAYHSTLMRRTHMPLTNDVSIPTSVKQTGKYIQMQAIQRHNTEYTYKTGYDMTGIVISQNIPNASALNKQDDVASTWYKTSTDYSSTYTPQSSRLSKGPPCSISIHPHVQNTHVPHQ